MKPITSNPIKYYDIRLDSAAIQEINILHFI